MEGYFVLCFHNFRERDESVDEFLSQNLLDDVLVIVIPGKGGGEGKETRKYINRYTI